MTPGVPWRTVNAEERVARLLEAGREARSAATDVREPDRDRRRQPLLELADARHQALFTGGRNTQERAGLLVAAIEESSLGQPPRERALELVRGRGGGGERSRWSRSQPSRAARPSRPGSDSPRASCSKKSLIRFFSVSRSISSIFFRATAAWLATARARSTSDVPAAASSPRSSSLATSGTATEAERPLRASSGPSSERPISARASALSGAEARRCSTSEAGIEQVQVGTPRRAAASARARRPQGRTVSSASAPARISPSSVRCSSSSRRAGASPRTGGRFRSRRRPATRSRPAPRLRPR